MDRSLFVNFLNSSSFYPQYYSVNKNTSHYAEKNYIICIISFIISFSLELNMELPAVQQQPSGTASTEQVIVYKGLINQSIKDLI